MLLFNIVYGDPLACCTSYSRREDIRKTVRVLGPLTTLDRGRNQLYHAQLLRSKEIQYCVEHIETDWRIITRTKDQYVMLKNAQYGRYVAAFCGTFMQGGVLSYCLVTAVDHADHSNWKRDPSSSCVALCVLQEAVGRR